MSVSQYFYVKRMAYMYEINNIKFYNYDFVSSNNSNT